MKVFSWNIRGNGSATRRGLIRAMIGKEKPDLIILQETKKEVVDRKLISSLWKSRFVEWLTLPALGRSGGIIIMWDPRVIKVKDNLIGEYTVSIQIQNGEQNDWWFSAVYGPCHPSLRNNFWDELAGLRVICGDRWCLGRDFNVVSSTREKINSSTMTTSMQCFDSLIQELQLCDPSLLNGKFTWSNLRNTPICCRLDRFLFTVGWTEIFPFHRQSLLPRITSDHFPLIFDLSKTKWGPSPFRFENFWLEDKRFKELTKVWWNNTISQGWAGYRMMMKLKSIKGDIKKWNEEVYGLTEMKAADLTNKISRIDKMEGEGKGSEVLSTERKEAKLMLEEMTRRKNQMNYQKSKVKWIKQGDQNSRFFHSILNHRKSKSTIDRIQRNDGSLSTCEVEIVSIISEFFQELYSKPTDSCWGIEGVNWCPIEVEMKQQLEKIFSEDEVKEAVFKCDAGKSPGADDFTLGFFQECWEIVKKDLMLVFDEFFHNGIINGITNETYICLIKKKVDSFKVKDFRPISLITSVYKIISKVLTERLKQVMASTISESQNAFVEGRQILDCGLIANELLEEARIKKKQGWVLKVDFEKAYDNVSWEFLDFVLMKKGFGNRWRSWIKGCVSNVSFSVMINGRPRGKFRAFKGLRQGDPLSPFLFNLVVDVLGRLIDKAKETNLIKGIEVGREMIEISHIQFADDTLFFAKNDDHIIFLAKVVSSFCDMSGLKINWEKSALLGINRESEQAEMLSSKLGCAKESWPISYLGVPLGGNPLKASFWQPVVAKMSAKLASWKKAFLSKGGRLTLILSVLNSIPIYYMSLFKVPKSVEVSMDKITRNFLWDGADGDNHMHLAAWDRVCKSKERGGLGIAKIRFKNKALLGKWWWRFFKEEGTLWKKIIVSKYGLQENGWDVGLATNVTFRCPWKFISWIYPTFRNNTLAQVRGGNKIRFWEDSWVGNCSFQLCFPSLFQLSSFHNLPISYFVQFDYATFDHSWDFHFRRGVRDEEIDELIVLLEILQPVRLVEGVDDFIQWSGDSSGIFSVSAFYECLFPNNLYPKFNLFDAIWKVPVPSKIQFFSWSASLGKLPSSEMIQKRCPRIALSPSCCVLCRRDADTQDHFLIYCPFTFSLWVKALQELRLFWVIPKTTKDLFSMDLGQSTGKRGRIFWQVVVQCICWTVWLERNQRIFEGKESNIDKCWEKIRINVAMWIGIHKEFKNVSVFDLFRHWDYVYH